MTIRIIFKYIIFCSCFSVIFFSCTKNERDYDLPEYDTNKIKEGTLSISDDYELIKITNHCLDEIISTSETLIKFGPQPLGENSNNTCQYLMTESYMQTKLRVNKTGQCEGNYENMVFELSLHHPVYDKNDNICFSIHLSDFQEKNSSSNITSISGDLDIIIYDPANFKISIKIKGELNLKLPGYSTERSIFMKRTYNPSYSTYTYMGDTSINGYENVGIKGTTRGNTVYYGTIPFPLEISGCPGGLLPTGGVYNIETQDSVTYSAHFGYDNSGSISNSCNASNYMFFYKSLKNQYESLIFYY